MTWVLLFWGKVSLPTLIITGLLCFLLSLLKIDREGKWLTMSTNEGSIHVIDCISGEEKKKLYAKTYGVGKVRYTHHESCILMSYEKRNYDLAYLCSYDNRYLRYFKGHSDLITSLSMSPIDDTFITSSLDRTVRLWNLSANSHTAKITLPQNCDKPLIASFDESGVIFGVMCNDRFSKKNNIKLFDARNYEAGPFQDIAPDFSVIEKAVSKSNPQITQKISQIPWTNFEFSADGNHLLVNTQSEFLFILDGFRPEAEPVVITTRKNESNLALGACFSSNAKYVLTSTEENEVLIYDKNNGELKQTLLGHVAPVGCIASNPRYDQIASGCVNTALWIPKEE